MCTIEIATTLARTHTHLADAAGRKGVLEVEVLLNHASDAVGLLAISRTAQGHGGDCLCGCIGVTEEAFVSYRRRKWHH